MPDPNDPNDPNAATSDPNAPAPPAIQHGRWPRSVILRPLTLPGGVFMAGVDITNNVNNFFDPAGIGILVGYGISDDFELAFAGYQFGTDSAGDGLISLGLGYKLVRGGAGGKLEAIARLQGGYLLAGDGLLAPLVLGAHVQYNVSEKLALYMPGTHLAIGLEEPNGIAFDLPVGVGFQATPELWAYLQTSLLTLAIKDAGDSSFIFADRTPLALGITYNVMPALDVNAGISMDLTNEPGDTLSILVGARYYGGKLN